jgi:glycosyltransferase involved in cell wall biosynthesis
MAKRKTWVIVAAYNEERHLPALLSRLKRQGLPIVVVDDGSKDRTSAVAAQAGVRVLQHIVNLGKGAAMKTGAEYALQQGAKAMIFIDGDGQHNPVFLKRFVAKLEHYDIVFSYRKRSEKAPLIRRFGGRAINMLFRVLYGISLQDSICGYRGMTAKAYNAVRWTSRDYSVESEMIARAGKAHLRYTEFPIDTIYHDTYKGMTVIDGISVVFNLLWWRLTL